MRRRVRRILRTRLRPAGIARRSFQRRRATAERSWLSGESTGCAIARAGAEPASTRRWQSQDLTLSIDSALMTLSIWEQSIIRRHLLFYAGSRDRRRYSELKNALALYRLVFGQPRQQDILEQVLAKHHDRKPQELHRSLAKYMVNLSPFNPAHAIKRANAEAQRLLGDPE